MSFETADAVVIGGGVHGTSVAYNLSLLGGLGVTLLERSFLASGATGRSAAGVRHQFGTEINCRLAVWNIRLLEALPDELEYGGDLEFRQGGYLLLAYSDRQLEQLRRNVALQVGLGISSCLLSPQEVAEVAPVLNLDGVVGASFCQRDGHVNPFHLTWAYAAAAKRLGTRICCFRQAEGIIATDSRVRGVRTSSGIIESPLVFVCAGAEGADMAGSIGPDVPVRGERHQILVTEPVEHVLDPMVLCFEDGSYFKQTPHGSFLMGIGNPYEPKGYDQRSSWNFLEEMAQRAIRHLPALAGVRVVRQWAGLYDITPDSQPIVGPTPLEGLWLDLGWSGHGLQFAPSIGRILAQRVLGLEPLMDISPFRLDRFRAGDLIPEPACV